LGVLLIGCGSSAGVVPRATPTPDIPALARQYQAAAAKSNTAQDALKAQGDAGQITKAQQFVGMADAEHQFATDLAAIKFPASMQADVYVLIKASAVYEAVLRRFAAATSPLEQSVLLGDLTRDQAELGAAKNVVRRDLGIRAVI
jgi:hypothetical protein